MEGNCCSELPLRHPPASMSDECCGDELTPSISDASVFNCEDILRSSADAMQDGCTAWTDEKHDIYIHQLEMSFVKQLHQSKCLVAQHADQSQRDLKKSRQQFANTAEQFKLSTNGSWQKMNSRGETPSCSVSTDTQTLVKSDRLFNYKHIGKHGPPLSGLKLCNTMKQGKWKTSSAQKFSLNKPSNGDIIDLTREGMGQNFIDEDYQ